MCRRLGLAKHGTPLFDATTIAKALCGPDLAHASVDSSVGSLLGVGDQAQLDVVGWMAMAMKVLTNNSEM
jgi:hypothetical protein